MLTSIIAIAILVLTALFIRALDKRSKSTSSPNWQLTEHTGGGESRDYYAPFRGEALDAHEASHYEASMLVRAAELCRSRESGRWLGEDIAVSWVPGQDSGADSAAHYLLKHGAANGVHVKVIKRR